MTVAVKERRLCGRHDASQEESENLSWALRCGSSAAHARTEVAGRPRAIQCPHTRDTDDQGFPFFSYSTFPGPLSHQLSLNSCPSFLQL